MLKEYALEPKLLSSWQTCRLFIDRFGYGHGRLISRYPRHWARLVYESLVNATPLEKKRIEQALVQLKDALYPRCHDWNPDLPWLQNAITEHEARHFDAIIADTDDATHADVICEQELELDPRWQAETQRRVERTPKDMAECVGPLLRTARTIRLVDPNFQPGTSRFRAPFRAFIAAAMECRAAMAPPRIELHTGDTRGGTKAFFGGECQSHLAPLIPTGSTLRVYRWQQRQLHNRYVLTEKGGLQFGTGLDQQGKGCDQDDVILLDRNLHRAAWWDYESDGSSRLTLVESGLTIVGSGRASEAPGQRPRYPPT